LGIPLRFTPTVRHASLLRTRAANHSRCPVNGSTLGRGRSDACLLAGGPEPLLKRRPVNVKFRVLCALGGDAAPTPGNAATPAALRYSEISRLLVGVSQKMLTQTHMTEVLAHRDGHTT